MFASTPKSAAVPGLRFPAALDQLACEFKLAGCDLARPFYMQTSSFRGLYARPRALPDQFALEFSQGSQHRKDQSAPAVVVSILSERD